MKNVEFFLSDTGLLPHSPAGDDSERVHVVTTRLDVAPGVLGAAEAVLSDAERARARRYCFEGDRRRFTVARSCLRQLLGARLKVRPEAVELVYGANGKPALSPRFAPANLHFNMSRSGDVAVFAFASGREVGIDVEAVRDLREADDIAAWYFSRREYASYDALNRHDRALGFFSCWTRKEAFIKALGDGLSHSLSSFEVPFECGKPAQVFHIVGDAAEGSDTSDAGEWVMQGFSPAPGHVAAVVARSVPIVRPNHGRPLSARRSLTDGRSALSAPARL